MRFAVGSRPLKRNKKEAKKERWSSKNNFQALKVRRLGIWDNMMLWPYLKSRNIGVCILLCRIVLISMLLIWRYIKSSRFCIIFTIYYLKFGPLQWSLSIGMEAILVLPYSYPGKRGSCIIRIPAAWKRVHELHTRCLTLLWLPLFDIR